SILTDSKVTPTKHGRMTKPYSSPCFIANCFNAGYLKMEVKTSATMIPYVFLEVTKYFSQRCFRHSDAERLSRTDEELKLKKFEKDASLKLSSYQIKKGDPDCKVPVAKTFDEQTENELIENEI
nr:hypothetical protein [Tanacetum cinerariifolium]